MRKVPCITHGHEREFTCHSLLSFLCPDFFFCYQAFILSGLFKPFCFEVLVVMIHPLPFVNYMVHVWGLDTYCAYSSDGELTPPSFISCPLNPPRMCSRSFLSLSKEYVAPDMPPSHAPCTSRLFPPSLHLPPGLCAQSCMPSYQCSSAVFCVECALHGPDPARRRDVFPADHRVMPFACVCVCVCVCVLCICAFDLVLLRVLWPPFVWSMWTEQGLWRCS